MRNSFKFKRVFFGMALLCASTVLTLVMLELAVRVFYPQSHYAIMSSPWGFKHIPNARISYYGERGEIGRPRGFVPIQYNSHGLRDYEYAYYKPEGVFRILALGDSWAEDMGSYLENLHVKRLEKKLNVSGATVKFEVINAGHYAYDDAQELLYFILEGKRYKPDIVIVFYSGDTAEPKYATLENGKIVLHMQNFSTKQEMRRRVISFFRKNSDLGSFILDRMVGSKSLSNILIKLKLKEDNRYASFPKEHPAVSLVADKGLAEKVVYIDSNDFKDIDKQIFLKLKKEVEKCGGKLVFMSVNKLHHLKEDFLKANGFYLLEVDIDFKKMSEDRINDIKMGKYDKKLDSHRFGYKRNEVVAQQILEFLRNKGLVPVYKEHEQQ